MEVLVNMSLDARSYQIVLQNLLNRATDIEIADAKVEGRTVSLENVEKNLGEIGKLFMKKIKAFDNAGKAQVIEEGGHPITQPKNTIKAK